MKTCSSEGSVIWLEFTQLEGQSAVGPRFVSFQLLLRTGFPRTSVPATSNS